MFKEDDFSKSKVFEWMMVNQLKAEFFWRDPYKHEVDIIQAGEKLTPIEIKYGKIDFKGLEVFMKKFKVNTGYIVSRDKEATKKLNGKVISVIPAFKFLLKHKQENFINLIFKVY